MRKWTLYLTILFFLSNWCAAQSYETILIGDQEWMKYNLERDVPGSIYYDSDSSDRHNYDRLYQWQSALDACPAGYRLPTDQDWQKLTEFLGGAEKAGLLLKEGGTSGFNVKLAGNYQSKLGFFSYQNKKGYYWTSTPYSNNTVWIRSFGADQKNMNRTTIDKDFYFSVRCIKNK